MSPALSGQHIFDASSTNMASPQQYKSMLDRALQQYLPKLANDLEKEGMTAVSLYRKYEDYPKVSGAEVIQPLHIISFQSDQGSIGHSMVDHHVQLHFIQAQGGLLMTNATKGKQSSSKEVAAVLSAIVKHLPYILEEIIPLLIATPDPSFARNVASPQLPAFQTLHTCCVCCLCLSLFLAAASVSMSVLCF